MHQNSEWDRQAQTRTITKHKVAAFIYLFIYCCLLDLEMESSATKFELYTVYYVGLVRLIVGVASC
jgi:hypothetical protein